MIQRYARSQLCTSNSKSVERPSPKGKSTCRQKVKVKICINYAVETYLRKLWTYTLAVAMNSSQLVILISIISLISSVTLLYTFTVIIYSTVGTGGGEGARPPKIYIYCHHLNTSPSIISIVSYSILSNSKWLQFSTFMWSCGRVVKVLDS